MALTLMSRLLPLLPRCTPDRPVRYRALATTDARITPISEAPRRGGAKRDLRARATLKLLALTVLLPLALLGLGLWETSRGVTQAEELASQRAQLARVVTILEARAASGRQPLDLDFRSHGQLYGGPYAITKAREELGAMDTALIIADLRSWLPPAVMIGGGAAAALSVVALLTATLLGQAGRASRERLVRGFGLVRLGLPPLMGAQVVLMAVGVVAAVVFESLAIPESGDYSSGGIKLVGIAVVAAALSLWTASRAVLELRRTMTAFTPEPLPVTGRPVAAAEAPGLWSMIDELAARLGALRPDNVVVGLTGGFFVTSGPKLLEPGGAAMSGRTLYVPLPYLPLLRRDEVAAIIGHELGHFSGGDTEWSLRFLPIYAGVERSLHAIGGGGGGSPLTRPSLRLGQFAMDRFHHAVRHWSRLREVAADAAGAEVTSADACARALLRSAAALPRIEETLAAAARSPDAAPADLVVAVRDHAATLGLDDPAIHLEAEQPHPTDTHPPTRQRLLALDRPPVPALLTEASTPPAADALTWLGTLFADPAALCRTATTDFLEAVRADRKAYRDALAATVAAVAGDTQTLRENPLRATLPLGAAAGFVAIAIASGFLQLAGLDLVEVSIVAGTTLLLAVGLGAMGLLRLRRGRTPFLLLRPEAMVLPSLDRPIAWDDIADLDMTLNKGVLTTRVLLPPEAPFPTRLPGARHVRLDASRGIVTLKAALPRGMSGQAFADLIGRYRRAAAARRLLAEPNVPPTPAPASLAPPIE